MATETQDVMKPQGAPALRTVAEVLDEVKQAYGFIPKVMDELSNSPAALCAYWDGMKAVEARSSLAPTQREIARLTFSVLNQCHYCSKAHAFVGMAMMGIDKAEIDRVRVGELPKDPFLAKVVAAARLIYEKKGWLGPEEMRSLAESGINRAQVYDLVTLLGLKVMSNYVNHIGKTPLDAEISAA